MIELCLVKCPDGAFRPATEHDLELSGSLKNGKGYTVKITQKSNRSYQHHKLFFGGLLALAFDYWQPTGGMVGKISVIPCNGLCAIWQRRRAQMKRCCWNTPKAA